MQNNTLESNIGRRFSKERHGQKTTVELVDVRKRNVLLRVPGRVDTFEVTLAEFNKFYRLEPNQSAAA
jgi:hypothetical protein